jgi:hypothetical protein
MPAVGWFHRRAMRFAFLLLWLLPACVYDLDKLRKKTVTVDAADPGGGQPDAAGPDAAGGADGGPSDGPTEAAPPIGLPESFPPRPMSPPIPMNAVGAADLAAYWPLDEGMGMYAWDVTGHGNDGVLLLETVWRPVGFPGALFANPSELQFDGIDDFAEFVPQTLPAIEEPKSISFWARYDYENDPARAQALMVMLNRPKSAGLRIEFRGGRLIASSYFYKEIVGIPAPAIGWHHIVYTYDANTHVLYLDGAMAAMSMVASEVGSLLRPDGRVRIARSSSGVDDAFRGFLDDVRVYKRALTAAEVKSLSLGSP